MRSAQYRIQESNEMRIVGEDGFKDIRLPCGPGFPYSGKPLDPENATGVCHKGAFTYVPPVANGQTIWYFGLAKDGPLIVKHRSSEIFWIHYTPIVWVPNDTHWLRFGVVP